MGAKYQTGARRLESMDWKLISVLYFKHLHNTNALGFSSIWNICILCSVYILHATLAGTYSKTINIRKLAWFWPVFCQFQFPVVYLPFRKIPLKSSKAFWDSRHVGPSRGQSKRSAAFFPILAHYKHSRARDGSRPVWLMLDCS